MTVAAETAKRPRWRTPDAIGVRETLALWGGALGYTIIAIAAVAGNFEVIHLSHRIWSLMLLLVTAFLLVTIPMYFWGWLGMRVPTQRGKSPKLLVPLVAVIVFGFATPFLFVTFIQTVKDATGPRPIGTLASTVLVVAVWLALGLAWAMGCVVAENRRRKWKPYTYVHLISAAVTVALVLVPFLTLLAPMGRGIGY